MPRGRRHQGPALAGPRRPARVSAARKFQGTLQALGPGDAPTSARLWEALAHTGHPLARRLWWFFVREASRPAAGFHTRLAAVLLAHSPQAWVAMTETLVAEDLVARQDATAFEEALLTLVNARGQWK